MTDDLAKEAGLSPSHFHRLFKRVTGTTPNLYVTNTRLEKAKELLVKSNYSIFEIALACGFENIPYFSYVFAKWVGIAPGDFRKRHSYK